MKTIRYLGSKFRSEPTGELTNGETAEVSNETADDFVAEHKFEYVDTDGALTDLDDLDGVGDATAGELSAHGFKNIGDLPRDAGELAERANINDSLAEHIVGQLE